VPTVDSWSALGDPTRRRILAMVARQPSSVTDLARELPVSRPAVSQHLRVLLHSGLVDMRPHGRERIYAARLDGLESLRRELDAFWTQALSSFKQVAEESYQTGE
jgi:DNA-binding transcriptional ArsR family regulator